ncbi:MAG: hypothetical protein GYA61_05520 [Spirochaetales bacterium]|jgi:predicted RNase H-like nuclease (RuvC/YqgF family)|nr:hypothetical protein [Exilispira sp.]NMC67670.1 hypothetical protein [Spirochaetales bacterium]
MKQDIINSLYVEVEKLIEKVKDQEEKIKRLENMIHNKEEQISYLKSELADLISKVEHFNNLFNELPIYNSTIEDIDIDKKKIDEEY